MPKRIRPRGLRVILDRDLADLYGVTTKALNQVVVRNLSRFPPDFAFTEHGIAMLSSVLRSDRTVKANVAIMRAFVRLREFALSHADLTRQIVELEQKYDGKFAVVFDAIRRLMAPPDEVSEPHRRIGFVVDRLPSARGGDRGSRERLLR